MKKIKKEKKKVLMVDLGLQATPPLKRKDGGLRATGDTTLKKRKDGGLRATGDTTLKKRVM